VEVHKSFIIVHRVLAKCKELTYVKICKRVMSNFSNGFIQRLWCSCNRLSYIHAVS